MRGIAQKSAPVISHVLNLDPPGQVFSMKNAILGARFSMYFFTFFYFNNWRCLLLLSQTPSVAPQNPESATDAGAATG